MKKFFLIQLFELDQGEPEMNQKKNWTKKRILNQKKNSERMLGREYFFRSERRARILNKKRIPGSQKWPQILLQNEDVYEVSPLFERFLGPRKGPDDV